MSAARVLEVLKDGVLVKSQEIQGDVDLGRGEGCVIRLEDRAISRRHAVFKMVGSSIQVEKVSEFAPLSLNGAECTAAVLKEGDVISIGPYLARIAPLAPEAQPQTASFSEAQPTAAPESDSDQTQSLASEAPASEAGPEGFHAPPTGMIEVSLGDSDQGAVIESTSGQIVPMHSQSDSPELAGAEPEMGLSGLDATPSPEIAPQIDEAPSQEYSGPIQDDAPTRVLSANSIVHRLRFEIGGHSKLDEFIVPEGETTIGRDETCGICLDEKKVSRVHAILVREGLTVKIRDKGSANGTYVNGQRTLEAELNPDDEIRIGGTRFRYFPENPEAERAAREAPDLPAEATVSQAVDPVSMEVPSLDIESSRPTADPISPPLAMDVGLEDVQTQAAPLLDAHGGPDAAVAGIAGIGEASNKKTSLVEKFRALPPARQLIWVGIIVGGLYFLLFDDPVPEPKQAAAPQAQTPAADPAKPDAGAPSTKTVSKEFSLLSPEKQAFVKERYGLAESHFQAKDYDKALFELNKIFEIVGDYNSARDYQRMALDGKKRQDAQKEEERRRAELERNKVRLDQLLAEVGERMNQKDYVQAKGLFSKILEIDPENPQVIVWDKTIREFEAEERAKVERARIEKEQNDAAWRMVHAADATSEKGDCKVANRQYRAAARLPANDPKVQAAVKAGIENCAIKVAAERDPVLSEAKQLEESQDFSRAYRSYQRATQIDSSHPDGFAGMDRIRKVLQDRAKITYTEAVLAESYSDYGTAVKKYKETQEIAPSDDLYFERAKRKLEKLYMQGIGTGAAHE